MTTCALIREKLEAGAWTPLEAARGLTLALGDDYVPGVSPSIQDPELWRLIALLVERGGVAVARWIKLILALVAL